MDKDSWIAEHMFPKNTEIAKNTERKTRLNVKSLSLLTAKRKTKITFCVLGSWAIYMPPYGLARLSALTRESGFLTRVYDFNVDSYHALRQANPELENAWDSGLYWWWEKKEEYTNRIFESYKPILEEYLEILLADDPDIIGFSCYYTNKWATFWMMEQIKLRKPDITIIAGGPECAEVSFTPVEEIQYYFVGESEQNILDFLNNWELGIKPNSKKIGGLYSDTRIDIDSLPYPDYSDFDLTKYLGKNSICAEISRGCIAKCTYCTEVYYWKFRDRGAKNVVDEIEYQVFYHDITFVNFVDSLMNGNLKEFRKFCEDLRSRNLGVNWWGYLRADGRMDREFYQIMKDAGARGFNYGFESGSDKVLRLINKKNTVAEINQNIIDADACGIETNACLVLGAPGEDSEAFMHTCNMIWNHRARIASTSPGPGLGDNPGSAYDNREQFNISPRDHAWMAAWYTLDLKNTRLHRMIRVKVMHMWVYMCKEYGNGKIQNVHAQGDITDHFKVKFDTDTIRDHLEYEEFDFNIINSKSHSDFANSLMNEVFVLLRLLWRARGGYEINIDFSWDLTLRDFAFTVHDPDSVRYDSSIWFKITEDGNYETNMNFKFVNNHQNIVPEINFDYTFNSTGSWIETKTNKSSHKTMYIKQKLVPTASVIPAVIPYSKMPLTSCWSGISYEGRNMLYHLARFIPRASLILETSAEFGGRSSIIASVQPSATIISCYESFPASRMHHESPWIPEQVLSECGKKGIASEIGIQLIEDMTNAISIDNTGRAAFDKVTSQFSNIIPIDMAAVEMSLATGIDHGLSVDLKNCAMIILNAYNLETAQYQYENIVLPCLHEDGILVLPQCHPGIKEIEHFIDILTENGWAITKRKDSVVALKRTLA
jgi:radical SAM superfamily enzyme YgiQ (UPF0313 family)